jgi:hypothetical protein
MIAGFAGAISLVLAYYKYRQIATMASSANSAL